MVALITGGAGFIGHHVAAHFLHNTEWDLVFLDRLDLSGNLNRLQELIFSDHPEWRKRCKWIFHDLKAPMNPQLIAQVGPVDFVFHMAASTHVDRSITHPLEFVYDNVVGTANLLEYCRAVQPREKIVYFSTDEVFGPASPKSDPVSGGDGKYPRTQWDYREWDRYRSANPYAATKAGGEELCIAYHNTYGLPILITHCMNVFGERQSPEKFIPMTVKRTRDQELVIVHADKTKTKAGSRYYIHARNVADAVLTVVDKGSPGDKYNIVGEKEMDNLELAKLIAGYVGKPLLYEMVDFHSSRPGHDLRYSLDGAKLATMGWKPPVSFEESMERVVKWTLDNPRWLL
jgi:dTDP-glucose 4,6-dehydratase